MRRRRFELSIHFPVYILSRRTPSATWTRLHNRDVNVMIIYSFMASTRFSIRILLDPFIKKLVLAKRCVLTHLAASSLFVKCIISEGTSLKSSPTRIARKVLNTFQHGKSNKYFLTPREIEVLQLLIKGYSAKMIANDLKISFDTARSHLKNIYQKLHVNSGKEAIGKALGEHMV